MAAQIRVKLSEVLEVRSDGLNEAEAWAILGQGLQPLEQLIENEKKSNNHMGLSTDSIFFSQDGNVHFQSEPLESIPESLLPPEYERLQKHNFDSHSGTGSTDLEKVFLYAFGAAVNYALKLDTVGSAASSPELYSVLNLMTLAEPTARMPLVKIAQIVQNQINQRHVDTAAEISGLYGLIMGSDADLTDVPSDDLSALTSSTSAKLEVTRTNLLDISDVVVDKVKITANGSLDVDYYSDDPFPSKSTVFEDVPKFLQTLHYEEGDSTLLDIEPSVSRIVDTPREDEHLSTIMKYTGLEIPETKRWTNDNTNSFAKAFGSAKEEHDTLFLLDMESPIGHSTALEHTLGQTGCTLFPDEPIQSPTFDSEWPKKHWVSFEGDANATTNDMNEMETDSDFLWMKPSNVEAQTNPSTISLAGSLESSDTKLMSSEEREKLNLSELDDSNADTLKRDGIAEPTFFQDPFSLDDRERTPISIPANIENMDFHLAFASDPTSPEKFLNSVKLRHGDLPRPNEELGQNGKLQILEKLMPTASATFTNPKDHGKLENRRSYHSVDCAFCTQNTTTDSTKRIVQDTCSLQHMTTSDSEKSNRNSLLITSLNKKSAEELYESDDEDLSEKRAALSRKLASLKDDDSLFASFDNLSSIATDKETSDHNTNDKEFRHSNNFKMDDSNVETQILHCETDLGLIPVNVYEIENDEIKENMERRGFDYKEFIDSVIVKGSAKPYQIPDEESRKVELYSKKTTPPIRSSSQEKFVPVLGVQQAMAMHKRQQESSGDNQQTAINEPERTNDYEGTTISEVKHSNVATTSSGNDSEIAEISEDNSSTVPTVSAYRNPSFVRNSLTRSARRQPSITQRQKQQQRRELGSAMSNGSTTMNGTGPEFLHKSRLQHIRLKAPKRKKLFRSSPDAVVLVILLNGQRVEVECQVDSTADDVFQVVSTHTNVMESHYFGLTHLRDGEHFFLEPVEKLSKFAPPGWRNGKDSSHQGSLYMLYFRLKYYPIKMDFIRTEQTLHQIYLQLRRDLIDEQLRCDRDGCFKLAAIALQAEYGDRPSNSSDYFCLDYYLPAVLPSQEQRLRATLADMHGEHRGVQKQEAEMKFVSMCQSAREYGIHFYRIYRTKPSHLLAPSPLGDPDTGAPLWIGLMPRGVFIFESRAHERIAVSQHLWHMTQTLQFDHKRFIIVTQTPDTADRQVRRSLIFYTDDYRKSRYLVHFAAAQHRFSMRMRFWASTLSMNEGAKQSSSLERSGKARGTGLQLPSNGIDSGMSNRGSETDSGISREASPEGREVYIGGELHHERSVDAVLPNNRTSLAPLGQTGNGNVPILGKKGPEPNVSLASSTGTRDYNLDISIPSHGPNGFFNFDETMSRSMEKRLDNATDDTPSLSPSDYEVFTVKLCKDPQTGLGLTLVDGEIQSLKGVYVKLLTPGGPAELEGRLRIGDKIISINGVNMESQTRHDVVQHVRNSDKEVEIGVLRLKSLYSSNESLGTGSGLGDSRSHHDIPDHRLTTIADVQKSHQSGIHLQEDLTNRRSLKMDNNVDFSKFGITTDIDYQEFLEKDYRTGGVRFTANSSEMYRGLGGDSEEEEVEDEETSDGVPSDHADNAENSEMKKYEKVTTHTNGTKKISSDDEVDHAGEHRTFGDGAYLKIDKTSSKSHGDLVSGHNGHDQAIGLQHGNSKSDIDWTNDLMRSRVSSIDSLDDQPQEDLQLFEVTLAKNDHGSLGIQVAGGKGTKKVYVKALVAEPALSCPDILPGDQLASVNGVSTLGMSHSDVVSMLKNATSPVVLGLFRPRSSGLSSNSQFSNVYNTVKEPINQQAGQAYETLEVKLEKPTTGSLGLSLAKPRDGAGIYIRVITPGSVAALDGRLKEGDRLWKINGELVAESTAEETVALLKQAQGFVHLVIRREKSSP